MPIRCADEHNGLLCNHGGLQVGAMSIKVSQINADTGEILDHTVLAILPPKRKNGFNNGWMAMSQVGADILAESNLGGAEFRLLWKLIAKLDFDNETLINQASIARELGMHRQSVQRSLKRLIALGVVIEGNKDDLVVRRYRLNPNFGWKGSAKAHVIALSEERRKRKEMTE